MDLLISYKRCKIICTTVSLLALILTEILAYIKTKDFRHEKKLWVLVWKIAEVLLWQKWGEGDAHLPINYGEDLSFLFSFKLLLFWWNLLSSWKTRIRFLAAFCTWKQVWNHLFFSRWQMKFICVRKEAHKLPYSLLEFLFVWHPRCRLETPVKTKSLPLFLGVILVLFPLFWKWNRDFEMLNVLIVRPPANIG